MKYVKESISGKITGLYPANLLKSEFTVINKPFSRILEATIKECTKKISILKIRGKHLEK